MITIFTASCKKDLGNYKAKEEITITGIADNYTKISGFDKLTIDPVVSSTEKDAEFEYLWGIYETSVQGSIPVLDTIGRTKALDYLVKQSAKGWVLVFRATNKKTGYSKYFDASINVVTDYTRGWYVAKDEDNQSDIDLFLTPSSITPESRRENIFSLVNGKKLEGKAQLFSFFADYKSSANGAIGNTRSLFLTTDKDLSVVNINTIKEIHNFNGLFYASPATKAPDFVCNGTTVFFVVNNGQLHSISNNTANMGLFGARQLKDNSDTPYKLSKYFMAYRSAASIFFDENSSSFISASGSETVMNSVTDSKTTGIKANNNNMKLLFMGTKSPGPFISYAIFQDKTNPFLSKV